MHSIWEGSISFGLINIPVKLYAASRERRVAFHFLHKDDLCPIKYVKVCKNTGEEIPYHEIVRGYEYTKGNYIVLDKKDFEKADVKKTHMIEVFQFVDWDEIDPIYYERPYYLEPEKSSQKAYALLREALKRTGKVGIAKFVLRTKEYLGAVKTKGDLIILDQIRYAEEIVSPKELQVPGMEMVKKRELDMATKLVGELSDKFRLDSYHDTYTDALEKLFKLKPKGKLLKLKAKCPFRRPKWKTF